MAALISIPGNGTVKLNLERKPLPFFPSQGRLGKVRGSSLPVQSWELLGCLQPPPLLLGGVSPPEQQGGTGDQPTFLQAPGVVRVHPLGKGADDLIVRVSTPRKEQHNLLLLPGSPKVLLRCFDPAVVMQEQEKGLPAQTAASQARSSRPSCGGEEGGWCIPAALSSSWAHSEPRAWPAARWEEGTAKGALSHLELSPTG